MAKKSKINEDIDKLSEALMKLRWRTRKKRSSSLKLRKPLKSYAQVLSRAQSSTQSLTRQSNKHSQNGIVKSQSTSNLNSNCKEFPDVIDLKCKVCDKQVELCSVIPHKDLSLFIPKSTVTPIANSTSSESTLPNLSNSKPANSNIPAIIKSCNSEDLSVEELSAYMDVIVYIPKSMSIMAEQMYT